jgi:hypothetical protein
LDTTGEPSVGGSEGKVMRLALQKISIDYKKKKTIAVQENKEETNGERWVRGEPSLTSSR